MGASVRVASVDWPQVISEIRQAGMMHKAIANRVGVAPSTLGNLLSGSTHEPCYSVGVNLLSLHAKVRT